MANPQIVIVKRAKGHGSHHGGAWKVAYADFVTAMMALFIVLWLMNTGEHTRKLIAGYFNDPMGKKTETGTDKAGTDTAMPLDKKDIEKLKEQLQQQMAQQINLKDISKQVEMTITPEGLRIELLETKDGTFFDTGGTTLKADGREILNFLAEKLSVVPNRVSIEGHTDSQAYSGVDGYTNWELSEERANVARRLMQRPGGLRSNQVSQVRGFADQHLRVASNPLDPSNRRVSLIVQNLTPADLAASAVKPANSGLSPAASVLAPVPATPALAPTSSAQKPSPGR
jgi:chemotaxis protein MotB